jgi:hypothetical protein
MGKEYWIKDRRRLKKMDKGIEELRRVSCFNLKEREDGRRKGIMVDHARDV